MYGDSYVTVVCYPLGLMGLGELDEATIGTRNGNAFVGVPSFRRSVLAQAPGRFGLTRAH